MTGVSHFLARVMRHAEVDVVQYGAYDEAVCAVSQMACCRGVVRSCQAPYPLVFVV